MNDPELAPRRRRRWPIVVPLVLVLILAAGWSIGWYYAADRAEAAINNWRAREAQAGRVYSCGSQSIGGYPFRIEVSCRETAADFRKAGSETALKSGPSLVAAQIYDPTLVIGEFTGPLTLSSQGNPSSLVINWSLAQTSVRGVPGAPERVSVVLDNARFEQVTGAIRESMLTASRAEVHGRAAAGSSAGEPAVELGLKLVAAVLPSFPLTAQPTDADMQIVVHGMTDFTPKPWSQRFRELQARNGRLDIAQARVQQGDILAVGAGSLALTPKGGLDGQLQITVSGLDKVLRNLRPDQLPQQATQAGGALRALDRLVPGLGNLTRQQAGSVLSAGLNMLGQQTKLEGRDAIALPLRFTDGAAFLGPIPVGRVPPLF